MMVLVIGGSGSGKSSCAEDMAAALSGRNGGKKYYLATMQAFGPEGAAKVARHRKLREGKGFLTIEQPTDIHQALGKMEAGEKLALLECISNLTANEMFTGGTPEPAGQVAGKILEGIRELKQELTHLIVVSNNVFEDGIFYDEAMMAYIRAMGQINQGLAAMADRVVESVVGIPVTVKCQEGC